MSRRIQVLVEIVLDDIEIQFDEDGSESQVVMEKVSSAIAGEFEIDEDVSFSVEYVQIIEDKCEGLDHD